MTGAIHQVLVAAAQGDAITNEAVRLRELLRESGPSEIYAHHVDARVPGVLRLQEYRGAAAGMAPDTLLYHFSIGEPAVSDFLRERPERVVLRYHNLTPAEIYRPFDPRLAGLLDMGRAELRAMAARAHASIAVSQFNALDLQQAGFSSVAVVPLLMDLGALLEAEAQPVLPPKFVVKEGRPLVTFVGRLAPNKGHAQLIQAFHVLKTYLRTDAHLFIVGSDDQVLYRETLATLVQQLALNDVQVTGSVPMGYLADIYRRTDVLLCMSVHEGFCAPLVEAMAFGVPVVALASSAIPETVGDAAILLDQPSPTLAAEAVNALLSDAGLRSAMVARGRRRARVFEPSIVGPALVSAVRAAAA